MFGALPFVFTKEIPSFVDAFFEIVSGFTTTGSSIITDLSKISHSNLFWRSFTHFVGGMGVLVLALAIFSQFCDFSSRNEGRSSRSDIWKAGVQIINNSQNAL